MKSLGEQTYYEILEVSPTATAREIQRAYEHAQETFHADSLAVYSLFSELEIRKIQAAIDEAYRVLIDEALRKEYDHSHLDVPLQREEERPPERPMVPRERRPVPPLPQDIPLDAEGETYRGRTLKQLRERMGIDLSTLSGETRINPSILQWIEKETVEKLPALVYLRGFLKAYARSLRLDPQKVVEGYLKFLAEKREK